MTIHVFVRHTSNNHGKFRPDWFSYEDCFRNLMNIVGDSNLTVVFDGDPTDHFVTKYKPNIVKIEGGTETKSFTKLLDYVKELVIADDDIIYFIEDDYIHRPGSMNALKDIFKSSNVDYVSLYDHADKYSTGYFEMYAKGFVYQLLCTKECHWRTTPSTTNSFAMKFSTLKRDIDIHYKYSDYDTIGNITQDHHKFCELWNSGKSLVTPIPGYSTHVENQLMSPTIDWVKIIEQTVTNE
jgi:hypothetical protein